MSLNYQSYVQRIRSYQKDSLLLSSIAACWDTRIYQDEKFRLLRSVTPRIFCISMATTNNHRSKKANFNDIFNLSNSYELEIDHLSKAFFQKEADNLKNLIINEKFKYLREGPLTCEVQHSPG